MSDAVLTFLSSRSWRFARTMPDWPHEYTVKSWRPDEIEEFVEFCQLIATRGIVAPWPPPPETAIYHNRYLLIDGFKYWAMGPRGDLDPPEEMTVINRAVHP
jgi:hypothetical protein